MGNHRSSVQGIGINDATYKIDLREKIKGKWVKVWVCPIFVAWMEMIKRCYDPYRLNRPRGRSYQDCTVCEEWLTFMNFHSWMVREDFENKVLDKDLRNLNNKIYSPDTCMFVTHLANTLLLESKAIRGEWPIGVDYDKSSKRWRARVSIGDKKRKSLGLYDCPNKAHKAWCKAKARRITEVALLQDDSRVRIALLSKAKELELKGECNG